MQTTMDVNAVTAVRMADGWHEGITDFNFFGDGQSHLITLAGAAWREPNGCRFSCTLQSLLAIREGTPVVREDGPASPTVEKIEPRDTKLEEATRWLEFSLRDGAPHRTKTLFEAAGNAVPRIRRATLERAYAGMPGHVKPFFGAGKWFWQLKPESEQPPQTTGVFEVSG